MVMPSPFDRMLQEAAELAARDPVAALGRLDQLYGKSLTDLDVRNLGALAAQIGGGVLGKWSDTVAFLQRCLEHPALEEDGDSSRSLHRAIAVVETCAGNAEAAEAARAKGVRGAVDRCRLAAVTAHMLFMRRRGDEALSHLREARELVQFVPPKDETLTQLVGIGVTAQRWAERQIKAAREVLLEASAAANDVLQRSDDWRERHKALFLHGRALVLAGRPAEALARVQELLRLEEEHEAGAEERFHSASLACRAQILRGQCKIAAGALRACRGFMAQLDDAKRAECERVLDELQGELDAARSAVREAAETAAAR